MILFNSLIMGTKNYTCNKKLWRQKSPFPNDDPTKGKKEIGGLNAYI